MSWDSRCLRLANWILFEDRETGKEFRVVNTHLDHVGQQARENQAALIVEDASAYRDDFPQILTGDMNCDAGNPVIDIFKEGGWKDSYGAVHATEDPGRTYHAFMGPEYRGSTSSGSTGKIDWIFFRGKVSVSDAEVIKNSRNGRFPSDHYFVRAELSLEP